LSKAGTPNRLPLRKRGDALSKRQMFNSSAKEFAESFAKWPGKKFDAKRRPLQSGFTAIWLANILKRPSDMIGMSLLEGRLTKGFRELRATALVSTRLRSKIANRLQAEAVCSSQN
jgi:hypothetical protein